MKNIKIFFKLIISFSALILFVVVIGLLGVYGMKILQRGASEMHDQNIVAISALADLREQFNRERNDIRAMFLSQNDPETVQNILDRFTEYQQSAAESFATYDTVLEGDARESAYLAAKETYLGAYARMKQEVFAYIEQGEFDTAYTLFMDNAYTIGETILYGLEQSTANSLQMAMDSNQQNYKLYQSLRVALLAVIVLSVLIAVWFTLYLSKSISKPIGILTEFMIKAASTGDFTLREQDVENIKNLSEVKDEIGMCISACANFISRQIKIGGIMEKVADGDLSTDVALLSDTDSIGMSLNKMVDNLRLMFGEISQSTMQVSSVSKQIAEGSQMLAQGSTEQAASLQQLSAAIAEITEKTNGNAQKADNAAVFIGEIVKAAEKGRKQMELLIQAANEINEASEAISIVIKSIDNIALQTNLLALNASVESAHAGQHGAGFAVVAQEVRDLSIKSTESSKETEELIANSMRKAKQGVEIANETSSILNKMIDDINQSGGIINSIAQASDEQFITIEQINEGIEQVVQVVQQNNSIAQQSAASSQEMSSQAGTLEQLTRRFKTSQ